MSDVQTAKPVKGDRGFTRGAVLDNIEALVVAIILALVLRCFLVEAFAIPTGSMGPTLYGDHYEVKCPECHYPFALGDTSQTACCPNCGAAVKAYGNSVWGGDRLLVNKLIYRFEKPNRWDPFVFINPAINPNDHPPRTTFIKRLIGLPSETLEIVRGDIVVDGLVQRKTQTAQKSLWMHVYDSEWPWDVKRRTWLSDAPNLWTEQQGHLSVDARQHEGIATVRFAGHQGDELIRDHYGYDGGFGANVVTDVRVTFDVTPRSAGALILTLPEDDRDLVCVIPVEGSHESAHVMTRDKGVEIDRDRFDLKAPGLNLPDGKLPVGKSSRIEFARSDYYITLRVNGALVLHKDEWTRNIYRDLVKKGQEGTLKPHVKSGVQLGADRLQAEFTWVRIDRDVYYEASAFRNFQGMWESAIERNGWEPFARQFSRPPFGSDVKVRPDYIGPISLNAHQYLALGDNSPLSADSRYWGPVPEENLIGKALVVWWYPTRIRMIH